MQEGNIVRIADRGFGFISRAEGDKDVFFHANSIQNADFNDLREGDKVTFEVEDGPKGPNAINVNRVD